MLPGVVPQSHRLVASLQGGSSGSLLVGSCWLPAGGLTWGQGNPDLQPLLQAAYSRWLFCKAPSNPNKSAPPTPHQPRINPASSPT